MTAARLFTILIFVTTSSEKIEPFHPVDDGAALDRTAKWAGVGELAALLVGNPARLYEF